MAGTSKIKNEYGSSVASKSKTLDMLAIIKELKWDAPAELSNCDDFKSFNDAPSGAPAFNKMSLLELVKTSLNAADAEIRDSAIDAARLLAERDDSGDEAKSYQKNLPMINLLKDYSDELLSMNEHDAFGNGIVLSSFFGFENIDSKHELKILKHITDMDSKVKYSAYAYFFSHKHSIFYQKALAELPHENNEIKYLFIELFSSDANPNKDEILQAAQLISDESAYISKAAMEAFYLKIGHEAEAGAFEHSIYKELSYEVASKVLSAVEKEKFSDTEADAAIKLMSLFIGFCSPLEMKDAIKRCMDSIYMKENASAGPIPYPRFAFGASAMQIVLDFHPLFEVSNNEYRDFKNFLSDFEHYKSFEILYSNKLLNKHLSILDIYSNYKNFNWKTWTSEEKSKALELGDTLAFEDAQKDAFYRLVFRVGSAYLDK
ncbi:hypothetical protein M1439_03730 [Candidatus Marsarchaeota archaeon]|nr:hypothetical protein [Candidatus Marsarchaeota archaeon]MCL5092295.1 hypothetical protein [Candidatus Marsarchaeota archaeon]